MTGPQLRVDLDGFAVNLDTVRARIAPAELMLVVKDDAYGHGLERIVRRAMAEGVRWFGAFDVQESLRTRAVTGAGSRIFSWLTVGADEIAAALAADIDLGVGDRDFLEEVAAVAASSGATARVHLKIDTGLHRNGIRPEDWNAVIAHSLALQDAGTVRVVGVWSHLAEASDDDDDLARALFDEAVAAAVGAGLELEMRHLAASAASFARPEFRYDLVRVGAFCYGVRPAGDAGDLGIRPIGTLVAPVTRVAKDAVTLGIGALHGIPSTLGGANNRIVRVGLTHMTLTPWPGAEIDQMVTVFGPEAASPTDLAESIGTVGEEILMRVSPLVPRRYT